jgi:predicted SnoaL-like aldol condensation-catalyzing enzyme
MSSASATTTLEQNKRLLLRWFEEVWNQARRETIFELFAPNGVIHDGPKQLHGPVEFAGFYDALRAEFSEVKITPIQLLAEGDLVCMHWSASANHKATGKQTEISGTSVVRIENGQFVEGWQNWDAAHLFTQLTGQPTLSF